MIWKIVCGILIATNATTATLLLWPKPPKHCKVYLPDLRAKLADGWEIESTEEQRGEFSKVKVYTMVKND